MASNYLAKGLKRSALTVALGLCFVGGVQAQTNTAGAVVGRAVAGDTITVTSSAMVLENLIGKFMTSFAEKNADGESAGQNKQ